MEQQQPDPQKKNGNRDALNFIVFAARSLSLGTTVFIRRNFGVEGIGMPGIGTIALIVGFVMDDNYISRSTTTRFPDPV